MRIIILIGFVLLSTLQTGENITPPDYIQVEFGGFLFEKAHIPTIVFSMERFDKDVRMYGGVYYFNRCEFLLISDEIVESGLAQKVDTLDAGYYKFFIVRRNSKHLFTTSDENSTKKLFMSIVEQIQDKKKRRQVESFFTDILNRLKY